MTAKTRALFKSDKNTTFADNATGDISALDLRNEADHLADSAIFPEDLLDQDDMLSNSATAAPTQQSVKAYVDTGLAGKAATSHTHAAADVTSGTFADALVAQTNVTQHQAALSISFSQIPAGDKVGNGTKILTADAAGTAGQIATYDAAGKIVPASSADLTDPGADRILFWDFGVGFNWLTLGTGLSLTGTTLAATTTGGDLVSTNNLSDLTNFATARTNLGVAIGTDVQAHSAVLDATTASYTTAEETKLAGIATGAEVNTINSTPDIAGSDQVTNVVSLTTAEYTGGVKDAATLYLITDAV